ncbi:MAG: hypothetical protein ACLQOO_24075 [Terriglobia bacterium]
MSGGSAAAQVHDVYYQRSLTPLNTTPTFDHGYLVVYDWDHRVDVFTPMGRSCIAFVRKYLAQIEP